MVFSVVCLIIKKKEREREKARAGTAPSVPSHSWVTRSFTAIQSSTHLALYNTYFYKLGCWGGGTTNVTFHAEIAWQQSAKFILRVCMT